MILFNSQFTVWAESISKQWPGECLEERQRCLCPSHTMITRQRELDLQLAQLQCRARSRQGRTVCWHILTQLRADKKRREGEERERSAEWEEGRERGVEGRERGKEERGEEGRERGEEGRERDAEREEERERSMEGEIPMQVDGAVEERYLKQPDPGQLASQPRGREGVGASFSLLPASPGVLDVCGMSVQPEWCPREEVVGRWRQQLRAVCVGEGGEETESSSDEKSGEEPQGQRKRRLQSMTQRWERLRARVGGQWVWLHHRITQLNQHLTQLDSIMKTRPVRDHFTIASPSHCIWSLPRTSLPQPPPSPGGGRGGKGGGGRGKGGGKGGGGRGEGGGGGGERGKVVNGGAHSSGPHLLISDSILGSRIQVKDLLTPNSLAANVSFIMDDSGCTAARTRPLLKKLKRTTVRLPQRRGRERRDTPTILHLDVSVSRFPIMGVAGRSTTTSAHRTLVCLHTPSQETAPETSYTKHPLPLT